MLLNILRRLLFQFDLKSTSKGYLFSLGTLLLVVVFAVLLLFVAVFAVVVAVVGVFAVVVVVVAVVGVFVVVVVVVVC